MTALMNVHMVVRLLEIEKVLDSFANYRNLKAKLNKVPFFGTSFMIYKISWVPSLKFILETANLGTMSQTPRHNWCQEWEDQLVWRFVVRVN
jgi:hypothetical protein